MLQLEPSRRMRVLHTRIHAGQLPGVAYGEFILALAVPETTLSRTEQQEVRRGEGARDVGIEDAVDDFGSSGTSQSSRKPNRLRLSDIHHPYLDDTISQGSDMEKSRSFRY